MSSPQKMSFTVMLDNSTTVEVQTFNKSRRYKFELNDGKTCSCSVQDCALRDMEIEFEGKDRIHLTEKKSRRAISKVQKIPKETRFKSQRHWLNP